MAVGAISGTHVLTRGGFEKLEFTQTHLPQKVRLYHIRDLTVEKIGRAKQAILEAQAVKGRTFEGEVGAFEQKISESPYLLRKGKSLRLISHEEMTQYFSQAFDSAHDQRTKASTCCKIGNTYKSLGYYQGALKCYRWCLEFAMQQQDERAEGAVYYNIANVFLSQKDYQRALTCYQKCLAIAENQKDQESLKRAYWSIGDVCHSLEKYQEALEHFTMYLEIGGHLDDQEFVGRVYCSIGSTCTFLGEYQQARGFYEQALKIGIDSGSHEIEMYAQAELRRL